MLARQLEERLAHGPLVQSRTRSRELPRSILLVGAGYFGLKHLLNILLMQSHFGARDYRVTVVSADDTSLQRAFLSGDTHATRRIVQLAAAGDQVGRALNAFTHAEREVLRRAWRESRIRFIDAQSDGSIVQLMRGGDSDCVFIATPAEMHYRYALEAMRAGASVFLEKPFTTNLAHALQLVEFAGRAGRTLHVDNINLFDVNFILVQQLLALGLLGEISGISYAVLNYFQHLSGRPHTILEEGIHATYVLMFLLGQGELHVRQLAADKIRPRQCDRRLVANSTSAQLVVHGVPVDLRVDLSFEPGTANERAAFAAARVRGSSGVERRIVIRGERGEIDLDFLHARGRLRVDGVEYSLGALARRIAPFEGLHEFPLYNSILHFYRRHLQGDASVEEPRQALHSLAETLRLVAEVDAQVALHERDNPLV